MNISNRIEALEEELKSLREECEHATSRPKMVKIPDRNYEMSETPITVDQYKAYCTDREIVMPDQPKPYNGSNPVTNVDWNDANNYCKWLSKKEGGEFRLPLEDEFEHCCGDHQTGSEDIAVFNQPAITTVKTKKPNKYGLYDMLGLVWEWQGR